MADLYLFDIDGTLINIHALHVATHVQALEEVVGLSLSPEKIEEKFGNPAPETFRLYLVENGKGDQVDKIPELMKVNQRLFLEELKNHDVPLLPGVDDFLNELAQRGCVMGIVTGNERTRGEAILKHVGIFDRFSVAAYADDGDQRSDIIRAAMTRAQSLSTVDRVVVIGDTLYDIAAAKQAEVIAIGVTTGAHSADQLNDADLVLDSLEKYPLVLEMMDKNKRTQ